MQSDLYTLGSPAPGSMVGVGYQQLAADTKFNLKLIEFKGERVVPLYSSMERLTAVIPEEYYQATGYLRLNCRTLMKILGPGTKFALNPGHMVVKVFSPDEVQALLDGTIFKQPEEKTALDKRIGRI